MKSFNNTLVCIIKGNLSRFWNWHIDKGSHVIYIGIFCQIYPHAARREAMS